MTSFEILSFSYHWLQICQLSHQIWAIECPWKSLSGFPSSGPIFPSLCFPCLPCPTFRAHSPPPFPPSAWPPDVSKVSAVPRANPSWTCGLSGDFHGYFLLKLCPDCVVFLAGGKGLFINVFVFTNLNLKYLCSRISCFSYCSQKGLLYFNQ